MLLKVDCLPNAVGKQPSIPLIYLGRKWTLNWWWWWWWWWSLGNWSPLHTVSCRHEFKMTGDWYIPISPLQNTFIPSTSFNSPDELLVSGERGEPFVLTELKTFDLQGNDIKIIQISICSFQWIFKQNVNVFESLWSEIKLEILISEFYDELNSS